MEFAFSESQRHWYESAVKFAEQELADPESVERERRGEFWREGYRRCARFGVQGLPVPTEYGGRGHDLLTTAAAMEASRAAKAIITLAASKAMESRSVAHEAIGGWNAARAKAMEACAGAAKVMNGRKAARAKAMEARAGAAKVIKSRNAAALQVKGRGSAAGP